MQHDAMRFFNLAIKHPFHHPQLILPSKFYEFRKNQYSCWQTFRANPTIIGVPEMKSAVERQTSTLKKPAIVELYTGAREHVGTY